MLLSPTQLVCEACFCTLQVFPTLKQLTWEAQWLAFQAELAANLSRPALVVPIFKPQVRRSAVIILHYNINAAFAHCFSCGLHHCRSC